MHLTRFVPDYLADVYTSSDYSKDGEVFVMQKATEGKKGIDLVFMGDGFVDSDMDAGGLYEQEMYKALNDFFRCEPLKTFRNRFNAYGVKVVSENNEWTDKLRKHRIEENSDTALMYAKKAVGATSQQKRVTVIYNTKWKVGRSYCVYYKSNNTFVAYIMAPSSETADLISHESCGHGLGQLSDEYVEHDGWPSEDAMNLVKSYDRSVGIVKRGANVDWRGDSLTVKWSRFLYDSRYRGEVGIFEGAKYYSNGFYRPSEHSIMRSDDFTGFNAPSREQIYINIMKYSEGDDWQYDYEKFVEYDAINRGTKTRSYVIDYDIDKHMQEYHSAPIIIDDSSGNTEKTGSKRIVVPLR